TEVLAHEPAKRIKTRDTLNYLRSVLRTTRDGFCVVDMNGRFLDVNDAYCEMCGYSREEFLQLSIADIDADKKPELTAARIERIRSTGSAFFQARNRRKDGTVFDVEVSASFLGGEEDKIVGFYRDITERVQADKELQERDLLLQKILDNSVDLISIAELDGTVRLVSKSHELLGYDVESLIGRNATELVHPDDAPAIIEAMQKIPQLQEHQTGEYRYRRADGEYLWFETTGILLNDDSGTPEQILFNTRDITGRKRAGEKLQLKSSFIDGISKVSPDLFITYDKAGVYLEIATANEDDLFLRREELLGNKFSEVLPEPATSIIMQGIADALSTNSLQVIEYELPIGNTTSNFEAHILPLSDDKLLAQVINITERKRAEQEIQRQLAEKETLLKEVHHRIKNNMAQVEGLLSLQTESSDNPEVQAALREAMSRVQSMRVLYEKLLIGNDYRDVSVKDYIESLVDSIIAVFPERANVSVEQKMGDFTLSSRKLIPVGIIINELLTNTFKYAFTGRAGGHVVIELDKTEAHITLTVQDDGIGLHDGVATNGSKGFGLTLVQMLAEQLNGTYTIGNDNGTKNVLELEA
ncbi:MAG: PAS domain S-box protein, partial [Spirochaetaceae bacterium]